MRRLLSFALTLGVLAVAGRASALSAPYTEVTYDLTGSILNITSPLSIANAAKVNGTAVLQFTATGPTAIGSGPADLVSFTANIDLASGGLAPLGVTGIISATLDAAVSGSLAGNVVTLPAGSATATGTINGGAGSLICTLSAVPSPCTIPVNNNIAAVLGSFTIANLNGPPSSSTATLPVSLSLGALGVTGSVSLVLTESGRSFVVPEPGTMLLVAAGLAGLAFTGRRKA